MVLKSILNDFLSKIAAYKVYSLVKIKKLGKFCFCLTDKIGVERKRYILMSSILIEINQPAYQNKAYSLTVILIYKSRTEKV